MPTRGGGSIAHVSTLQAAEGAITRHSMTQNGTARGAAIVVSGAHSLPPDLGHGSVGVHGVDSFSQAGGLIVVRRGSRAADWTSLNVRVRGRSEVGPRWH